MVLNSWWYFKNSVSECVCIIKSHGLLGVSSKLPRKADNTTEEREREPIWDWDRSADWPFYKIKIIGTKDSLSLSLEPFSSKFSIPILSLPFLGSPQSIQSFHLFSSSGSCTSALTLLHSQVRPLSFSPFPISPKNPFSLFFFVCVCFFFLKLIHTQIDNYFGICSK